MVDAPQNTVNVPASDAPFRKVIDSTSMITVSRLMPIIATAMLGALGWFGTTALTDIKDGQRNGLAELKASQISGLNEVKDGQSKVWVQIGKMVDTQSASVAIQSGLSVQVANTAKQLDHLQAQVDSLPK